MALSVVRVLLLLYNCVFEIDLDLRTSRDIYICTTTIAMNALRIMNNNVQTNIG